MEGMAFDAHFAATQRLAMHDPGVGGNAALAGKAEIAAQMPFCRRGRRKQFGSLKNFDEAFLTLALFAAGRGHANAQGFRALEQGKAADSRTRLVIEMQLYRHRASRLVGG
jgi:hypothetical protein